jgi:hypothetical protein
MSISEAHTKSATFDWLVNLCGDIPDALENESGISDTARNWGMVEELYISSDELVTIHATTRQIEIRAMGACD